MTDKQRLALVTRLRFAEWRLPPVVLVPPESLSERCARLDAADVDAGWLGDLVSLVEELPLLDANHTGGLGVSLVAAAAPARPAFFDELSLSAGGAESSAATEPEPEREAARGLAQLVVQMERVKAWADAKQAAAMAALGRPGVAVPVGDLLDAVTQGGSGGPLGVDSAAALRDNDFEATTWQQVSVSGEPAWDDAASEEAMRIAAAEVGAQLAWATVTARARMSESTDVVDNLPVAHRLWSQGRLDRTRVTVLADRTRDLDPAARELVEEQLLADGGAALRAKTPARVRALVDRCAAALDPDAIRRRQERARQDRDVFISPRDDGISRFCADVSTPVALLARSVIDSVAQGLPAERSIGQRRADVFADLFTRLAADGHVDLRGGSSEHDPTPGAGEATDLPADSAVPVPQLDQITYPHGADAGSEGNADAKADAGEASVPPPGWEGIDSGVTVIVEASVLAGVDLTDTACIEGALLGSHPALPADLVTALALSARRARIAIRGASTTDGATPCASGCADARTNLTIGADVYRPPAKLVEQVVLRDRVCRFPGCRHPARACDLDHRVPFADGGPTTAQNLDALCRFHHRLKTFTGWRAIRSPGNRLTWTSPLGARVSDDPELMPPEQTLPAPIPASSSRQPQDDPPPF